MDEDTFNTQLRKFLKKLGITSQREIESAVRQAIDSGQLAGTETLSVKAVVRIETLGMEMEVDDDIRLE